MGKCDDSFLLVRLAYAHRLWTLPGGAVERGETFEQAACRELFEETGIVPEFLSPIGDYESTLYYMKNTVRCFIATSARRDVKINPIEIAEAKWFALGNLPADRSPRVSKIIEMY